MLVVVRKLFKKNLFIETIYLLLMEVVVLNLQVALTMVMYLHNKDIIMLVVQHMKHRVIIKQKDKLLMLVNLIKKFYNKHINNQLKLLMLVNLIQKFYNKHINNQLKLLMLVNLIKKFYNKHINNQLKLLMLVNLIKKFYNKHFNNQLT